MSDVSKYSEVCKKLFNLARNFNNNMSFSCVDRALQDYVMYVDSEDFYGTTPGDVVLSPGVVMFDFELDENRIAEAEFLLSGCNMTLFGQFIIDNELFVSFMTSQVNAELCLNLFNELSDNFQNTRSVFLREVCLFFNGQQSVINGFGDVRVYSVLKYLGLSLDIEDRFFGRERFIENDFRKLEYCAKDLPSEGIVGSSSDECELLILCNGSYERYKVNQQQLSSIRDIIDGRVVQSSEIGTNSGMNVNKSESGYKISDPFGSSQLF